MAKSTWQADRNGNGRETDLCPPLYVKHPRPRPRDVSDRALLEQGIEPQLLFHILDLGNGFSLCRRRENAMMGREKRIGGRVRVAKTHRGRARHGELELTDVFTVFSFDGTLAF